MYEEILADRLSYLRNKKGVSARDMSISIGQNPGYINSIENQNAMPSMSAFFYICEFLDVSPSEFFDTGNQAPELYRGILSNLRKLDHEKIAHIAAIVEDML